MRRMIVWGLALLVLAGCQLKAGSPTLSLLGGQDGINRTIPLIQGTVVDAAGKPVEGASVRAYRPRQLAEVTNGLPVTVRTTSDAAGRFTLTDPPSGVLAVEASRPGLDKALRRDIQVAVGQALDLGTLALAPTGGVLGRVSARSGASMLGTDVFIPGTDYLAKTTASGDFAITEVPVGTYSLAFMAPRYRPLVVEAVGILSGQLSVVAPQVLELDAPELLELDPPSAGPGASVTLRGHRFGASQDSVLQVSFGDVVATSVRRVSDDEIVATVPAGASSGPVVVRSNGVPSMPLELRVIARLTLDATNVGLSPGESFSWRIAAQDDAGRPVADPRLTLRLEDPTLGVLDTASASFRAGSGAGVTRLVVSSGTIRATSWVGVTPFTLTSPYGIGLDGRAGDDGPARLAEIGSPASIARDAVGNTYLSQRDEAVIRVIGPEGQITRFAGSGSNGIAGDGGLASLAQVGRGCYLEVDPAQRLWLADGVHHVVRFIPLDDRHAPAFQRGYVYRAAGTGEPGYDGSGLEGSRSRLANPLGLALSPDGMLVVDVINHRIRMITWDLRLIDVLGTGTPGRVEADTLQAAAPMESPWAVARDSRGNLIVSTINQVLLACHETGDYFGRACQAGRVYPLLAYRSDYPGDGEAAATGFREARRLQLDAAGNCYFIDNPSLIRRLSVAGRVETLAGRPLEAASGLILGFEASQSNPLQVSLGSLSDLKPDGSSWWVASSTYHRLMRLTPR